MINKKEKLAGGIVQQLRKRGFSAYFVGGSLRDLLMHKAPKDFDIATDAKTRQIEKVFAQQIHRVGAQFGTVLVIKDEIPFQVSTFRTKYGKFSTSLLEDVESRDFTINGLAYDPLKKKIIDLVDAKADIHRKKIRAIGDASLKFAQDPLRLIRAIRFAVTLNFDIEHKTWQTLKRMARFINRVSLERIREELNLILTSTQPGQGLKLLDASGLLKYILPEVDKLKGVRQPSAFHPEGDVFEHTLLMLRQLKNPSLVLAFACLLHDIGKPQTFQLAERIRFNGHDKVGTKIADRILKELRFSNKDRQDIVDCVENHMRMMEAPKMREATLKRLFSRPTFAEELALHRIDCLASHQDLQVWRFLQKRYTQFKKRPEIPKPLLNGNKLIKMGFTPGPIFGKILKQMVDWQLEGRLKDKAQAKRWVVDKFKQ